MKDTKKWLDISVSVLVEDEAEAQELVGLFEEALCPGDAEGNDHDCARTWSLSHGFRSTAPMASTDNATATPLVVLRAARYAEAYAAAWRAASPTTQDEAQLHEVGIRAADRAAAKEL